MNTADSICSTSDLNACCIYPLLYSCSNVYWFFSFKVPDFFLLLYFTKLLFNVCFCLLLFNLQWWVTWNKRSFPIVCLGQGVSWWWHLSFVLPKSQRCLVSGSKLIPYSGSNDLARIDWRFLLFSATSISGCCKRKKFLLLTIVRLCLHSFFVVKSSRQDCLGDLLLKVFGERVRVQWRTRR